MNTQVNENDPLKSEDKKQNESDVPYLKLYRFASKFDYGLMILSMIGAIGNGLSMPIYSIIFGDLTDSYAYDDDYTKIKKAGFNTLYMAILGISTLLVTLLMYATFSISTENQTKKLRKCYLESLLKKQVMWYDQVNTNALNQKINNEISSISDAIGEKTMTFTFSLAAFISGFIVGYIKGWKLALVITSALPILAITIAFIGFSASWREQFTLKSDIESSAVVEETLSQIKTVKMLDGEDFEYQRFKKIIQHSSKTIIKYGLYYGLSFGSMSGFQQWTYALGIFYSGQLVSNQVDINYTGPVYTSGSICTVFFAILMGSFSLGQIGPCLQSFAKGKLAAKEVFKILDEKPIIEENNECINLNSVSGDIQFKDVSFAYPSKQDIQVLKNITFTIPQGKKVAFVGQSGSGKSTISQLLLKFYEIDSGVILIGNNEIPLNQIGKQQFRQKIAIVSQEPALFNTTIRENLKLGNQNCSDEELKEMLISMNASELIDHLDTNVGINGNQFSGGQKQRIALARALLQKPEILILDEATSALDRTNEQQITKIIDERYANLTRIVIAHRLTTIQDSDIIFVFLQGQILGQGTHTELLQNCEQYAYLISKQQTKEDTNILPTQTSIEAELIRKRTDRSPKKTQIFDINQSEKSRIRLIDTENEIAKLSIIRQETQQKQDTVEIKNEKSFTQTLKSLILLNYNEIHYLIFGCLTAFVNGSIYPLFSQVIAEVIEALLINNPQFNIENSTPEQIQEKVDALKESILKCETNLFILGFVYFISTTIECFCFSVYSERLTIRMRLEMFNKFLHLPVSFYDNPNNNVGFLTSRVTTDARTVQQLFQNIIGFKCQYYSAIFVGFTLAFVSSWKLTLLAIGVAPLSYFGSILSSKYVVGSQQSFCEKVYVTCNRILMESLTNIRTVYSLRAENVLVEQYTRLLEEPSNKAKKLGAWIGVSSGYAQMKPFLVNGYLFFMGTLLLYYDGLAVLGIYQTILAIIFAVVGGAKDVYFQSDNSKAQICINYYLNLLEVEDEFQREIRLKSSRLKIPILGNLEFKDVIFSYPQRQNILVLNNLNLRIDACSTVGFVGSSGCGKSTLFQLLLRFYDIDSGDILLDGKSIYDFDLKYLRQHFAIVQQEPQLFNESIYYNIKYNLKNITQEDIENASKLSHAYDFIMQEDFGGFQKKVGSKGSLISGGQKQRIAISRALLRNSSVFLFDEATSALDSNVESIVQKQLEEYLIGKTSIVIAHRISTIKNCKVIYVFDKGQVIEQGDYNYLVNQKGHFYHLEQGLLNQDLQNEMSFQQEDIDV
ncbi:unnamed protein product [Paramecium primaurelia]|uniref:ABC transporter family protein n=1 Tax=Paramecium primaurelia TaxID=5886 RepID=A0A8S1LVV5_PARPR|nr:unnamed protein product [Paramecium primaurelia]